MKTLLLWNKETKISFSSAMAYVIFSMYLLIVGYIFYNVASAAARNALYYGGLGASPTEALFRPVYHDAAIILLFFSPFMTMRLFAEERRSGTLELLFTYPFVDLELILGKFLAATTLLLTLLVPMILYPLFISRFAPIEWPVIGSQLLGLFLLGTAYIAVGLWASSLSNNQIVAAMISLGTLLAFWLVGWAEQSFSTGGWTTVLGQMSLLNHYENFSKGIISMTDISFYIIFVAFFLYATLKVLEGRTWQGARE